MMKRIAKKIGILSVLYLLISAGAAQAYDGLTFYGAEISPQDRINSEGQSLKTLRELLRQDRANYHRFNKRDPRDQNDGFFQKAEKRAYFDKANIRVDPTLEKELLSGRTNIITVWVYSENSMEVTRGLPAQGAD